MRSTGSLAIIGQRLWRLGVAAGLILCVLTLCGFGGRWWWVFDLCAQFRVQYFASALSLSLLFGLSKEPTVSAQLSSSNKLPPSVSKRWVIVLLTGLCALINFAMILPYYIGDTGGYVSHDTRLNRLRVISINVNTANQQYDLVQQFILSHKPDFLFLEETNATWIKALTKLEATYPYRKYCPRDDNFGMAFYSKHTPLHCDFIYEDRGTLSIAAVFSVHGQHLTLIGTHLLPPISQSYAEQRNQQLASLTKRLLRIKDPKLVIGDFNLTPWSFYFNKLLSETKLLDSAKGHGVHPTWLSRFSLFGLPIDHCLTSSDFLITDRRVGAAIGSDHFPLVVDFTLGKAKPIVLKRAVTNKGN